MMLTIQPKICRRHSARGFSLIELLIAIAIFAVITAIALPRFTAARRLQRLSAVPKQAMAQLRFARQQAMSRRRAVTFQYDDQSKQIAIIAHNGAGTSILGATNYPNTTGSTRINFVPLTDQGLSASEITYGIPSGAPTSALDDGTSLSAPSSNMVNITFQPDGSVINLAGQPVNYALYFYNQQMRKETASAISVLGSAGRIKMWRYSTSANKYVE